MIETWLAQVKALGSTGAHLGVDPANARAIRFYRAYGLIEPPAPRGVLWFARSFRSAGNALGELQPIGSGPHQPGR